jgi:nicotinamide-nucleotide amidase
MKGDVTVGIYASLGEVDLKITAKALNRKTALANIKKVESKMVPLLGDIVYGFDDDTLESAVGKLLLKNKLTLSVAESCTGGLIANRITNIPGSSRYFKMGVITYSNESKVSELDVSNELIDRHGAVSRQVALAMAKGLLKRSRSDYALSVTGIAGPTGGTKQKPIGLVYIALASWKKLISIERHFLGNRLDIKLQASTAALDLLRKRVHVP